MICRPRVHTVFVLAWLATQAVAQPAPSPSPAGHEAPRLGDSRASHLIKIERGSSPLPLTGDVIQGLLDSVAVRDTVLREVMPDDEAARAGVYLTFTATVEMGGDVLVGRLTASELPSHDMARRVLDAAFHRLRDALVGSAAADRADLERQLALARDELADAEAEYSRLQERQNALREKAGRIDLDPQAIGNELSDLRANLRNLELQTVARQAREAALAERIAEIGARVERELGENTVVREMERVLELREQELARTRRLVESGQAGEAELLAALEQVARSRAEIAERRHAARMQAGGDQLASLNEELADLATQTAEAEAHRAWLQDQLNELGGRDVLRLAAEFERESLGEWIARSRRNSAEARLLELERQLRSIREPQVHILGAAVEQP